MTTVSEAFREGEWPAPSPGARVLVVIETEPLAGLVATLLERGGYRVLVVPRLDAAPDRGSPDLVIVDLTDRVELPDTPPLLEGVPVLALTSVPVELVEPHEPADGSTSWLGKPFSPVVLLGRVARLLDPESGPARPHAP